MCRVNDPDCAVGTLQHTLYIAISFYGLDFPVPVKKAFSNLRSQEHSPACSSQRFGVLLFPCRSSMRPEFALCTIGPYVFIAHTDKQLFQPHL